MRVPVTDEAIEIAPAADAGPAALSERMTSRAFVSASPVTSRLFLLGKEAFSRLFYPARLSTERRVQRHGDYSGLFVHKHRVHPPQRQSRTLTRRVTIAPRRENQGNANGQRRSGPRRNSRNRSGAEAVLGAPVRWLQHAIFTKARRCTSSPRARHHDGLIRAEAESCPPADRAAADPVEVDSWLELLESFWGSSSCVGHHPLAS